jgi:hypothetical protein
MVWLYRSPIQVHGEEGGIYSFKLFLPLRVEVGRGEGAQHPVVYMSQPVGYFQWLTATWGESISTELRTTLGENIVSQEFLKPYFLWNCFPTFTSTSLLLSKIEPELPRKCKDLRQTKCHMSKYMTTESIEWFIPMIWIRLLPHPLPPPPSVSSTGDWNCEKQRQLAVGREGRGGGEDKSYEGEKPGPQ